MYSFPWGLLFPIVGVCDKIRIDEALAVVAKRLMIVPLDETSARCFQYSLRGTRVPMHCGSDSWVNVRRTVSDEADLQRTADGDEFGGAARLF